MYIYIYIPAKNMFISFTSPYCWDVLMFCIHHSVCDLQRSPPSVITATSSLKLFLGCVDRPANLRYPPLLHRGFIGKYHKRPKEIHHLVDFPS